MKRFWINLLMLCLAAPALAEETPAPVKPTISAFVIKRLPENESPLNDMNGTTVGIELKGDSEKVYVTGVEIDESKISFKDSTGKDLFAAGKIERQAYHKKSQTFGEMRLVENALSVYLPRWMGRDKVKPGVVYLRCHALTCPGQKASAVLIQGEIDVYTASEETKTATITKAQLTSKEGFKAGDSAVRLEGFGGGSSSGRSYSSYELASLARVTKIAVVGRDQGPSPVVLEGQVLKVYSDEISDTDTIELTYAVPKRSTLELDLEVTPGSVGQ